MKRNTRLCTLGAAGLLGAILPAIAGNLPQYRLTQTPATGTEAFVPFTDGTFVAATFVDGSNMVFADGTAHTTAHTGVGFPIGFPFRFGGNVVDQFAIDPQGYLLFGKGEVNFKGNNNLFFQDATRYANNHFYAGMGPIKYGVKSGNVSYKLEGAEGNRKLTVQFADMNVKESGLKGNAVYTLQIVLSEKDNSVSYRFLEVESPFDSHGLVCGLAGWENSDRILVCASGIGEAKEVASNPVFSMTDYSTFIYWDADDYIGGTHDNPYCFTMTFTPEGPGACKDALPVNLKATQDQDQLTVECARTAEGSATLILVSEKPFGSAEVPEDGKSYQVRHSDGSLATQIGEAWVAYYGHDAHPIAKFPGMEPSKEYYIRAYAVNGYPSYSSEATSLVFTSSHPAPNAMTAEGSAANTIRMTIDNDSPVLIAATYQRAGSLHAGEIGIFGTPEADAAVGDDIEGGGTVVYVGEAGEFEIPTDPNRLTFYRAWTVKDGRLSATWLDTKAVPTPSLPYIPRIEDHSLYVTPTGWTNTTTNTDPTVNTNFVPTVREGAGDNSVKGASGSGSTARILSPALPLAKGGKLEFDWAMETVRDPKSDGESSVELPQGNEPGKFGLGHKLTVTAGKRGTENTLFETDQYNGEMTPIPGDESHYQSGSATWQHESVDVPALSDNAKLAFAFSTEKFSYLFLRNIVITGPSGEKMPMAPTEQDELLGGEGFLSITSTHGGEYTVFTVEGKQAASVKLKKGETVALSLEPGIYLAAGRKVMVK